MTKKPQIIRFEQNHCNASVNDNEVLFVRIKDEITDPKAYFEVPETHVAFVIKGGGDRRFYTEGTYPVFDNKAEIKLWKKGFTVDVVYIPVDTSVKFQWGTPNRVSYRDEASNKVISVGANGEFGITITNYELFFRKVVGVREEFDLNDFRARFLGEVVNEYADFFLKVVNEESLTYDQFDAHRKMIGDKVCELLSDSFDKDWGIRLVKFIIAFFQIDDKDTEAVEEASAEARKQKKWQEYLAELERLDDKQWEREKYLRKLELEDRNAYYEVMKVIGRPKEEGSGSFCPKCSKPIRKGDIFCSSCGKRLVREMKPCIKCGQQIDSESVFCPYCGTKQEKDAN